MDGWSRRGMGRRAGNLFGNDEKRTVTVRTIGKNLYREEVVEKKS